MTTPDPLVSVEELAGWLRATLAGSDAEWAGLVLDAVSALIRDEAGLDWADGNVPGTVRAVTFEVAARVYRNPEALASYSKTTGPFAKSGTFANPRAVGLYLSDEEKALVGRSNTSRRRGLFTIPTTRADPCSTGYVPVEGGGADFPWYGDDIA